jgi:hypothetical protein
LSKLQHTIIHVLLLIECIMIVQHLLFRRNNYLILFKIFIFTLYRFSETDELKKDIESLKRENDQIRTIVDRTDVQSKQVTIFNYF